MSDAKTTHSHADGYDLGNEIYPHLEAEHGVRLPDVAPRRYSRQYLVGLHEDVHRDAEVITLTATHGEWRSMLGEGFHTAFRKATDDPLAMPVHRLIDQLGKGEYRAVLDFVLDGMESMARPKAIPGLEGLTAAVQVTLENDRAANESCRRVAQDVLAGAAPNRSDRDLAEQIGAGITAWVGERLSYRTGGTIPADSIRDLLWMTFVAQVDWTAVGAAWLAQARTP